MNEPILTNDLPNWEDPLQYPKEDKTALEQWCWEFIRRSPEYLKDWESTQHLIRLSPSLFSDLTQFMNNQFKNEDTNIYTIPNDPVNKEYQNYLKKWSLQTQLIDPKMNCNSKEFIHAIWWKRMYGLDFKFPHTELRPMNYGIHTPNRFAIIFSLERAWTPQYNEVMKKDIELEKGLLLPRSTLTIENINTINHPPLSNYKDILHLLTVNPPLIGFSFKIEPGKKFGVTFRKQLKAVEKYFKEKSKSLGYTVRAPRNEEKHFQKYLRILDATRSNIPRVTIGRAIYSIWDEPFDHDMHRKLDDDIKSAENWRDNLAVKYIRKTI